MTERLKSVANISPATIILAVWEMLRSSLQITNEMRSCYASRGAGAQGGNFGSQSCHGQNSQSGGKARKRPRQDMAAL
ncbi:MAG: hypothetical protein WA156_04105 [Methylocystis silviterrae]